MSFEEGALIEPLSVGMHAMKRGGVSPADRILITGLGPVGLLSVQAAKLHGVSKIYASDVVPFRQQLALDLGVTSVINPLKENVSDKIDTLTSGKGIDVIIETSGNKDAIAQAIKTVNRGGRVVFIEVPTDSAVPIDVTHIVDSELDIYGVFRFANTYQAAIQVLSNTNINIEKVITHKYSLENIREAVEIARTQKDKSIKVMIYPNKDLV